MSRDLSEPIRTAIISNVGITALLGQYVGAPAVFTRRPAPAVLTYPAVMISPDVANTDEDGLTDDRPVVVRDITVYGQNDTPEKYRVIEALGYALRQLFHRQKRALQIDGFRVIDLVVSGPIPAPVDDEQTVGRIVTLTVRLEAV